MDDKTQTGFEEKHTLSSTQFRFTPDAGTVAPPVYCGVCGLETNVRLGLCGSRSWAEAMSKYKSCYDEFMCPDHDKKWHQQVVKLREEMDRTSSKRIKDILREEVAEILLERKPTC